MLIAVLAIIFLGLPIIAIAVAIVECINDSRDLAASLQREAFRESMRLRMIADERGDGYGGEPTQ